MITSPTQRSILSLVGNWVHFAWVGSVNLHVAVVLGETHKNLACENLENNVTVLPIIRGSSLQCTNSKRVCAPKIAEIGKGLNLLF